MVLKEAMAALRRLACWLLLVGIGVALAIQGLGSERVFTTMFGAAVIFLVWIFEQGQASSVNAKSAKFMADLCNMSPYTEGPMGDTSCFFCSATILDLDHPERAPHTDTCLWARARKANPQ